MKGLRNMISSKLSNSIARRVMSTKVQSQDLSLNFILPDSRKKLIELNESSTLFELETEIKKMKYIEHIEFKTWDNSIISKSCTLKDSVLTNNEPIFVKIDKMEWQELKNNSGQKVIINSASEKDKTLETLVRISKNSMSNEEYEAIELKIHEIKNYYKNTLDGKIGIGNFKSLSQLFEQYYDSKAQYFAISKKIEGLERSSSIKALIIILFGGLLFVVELGALYYGTFHLLSWDITEPITYLVTCFNLLLALIFKRKMGKLSPHDYFKSLFLKRGMRKLKISDTEISRLKSELHMIENKLI